jgi:chaperone required for assembly of F1-ATPase
MKRFYKDASAGTHEGALTVLLDGRPVRTPKRTLLAMPTAGLAEAVAGEWRDQVDEIVPTSMPLTQLVSTALDRIAPQMDAVVTEVVRFAETDLVCYRAETPESLVLAEHTAWSPLVVWLEQTFGARLAVTSGIQPIPQPAESLAKIRTEIARFDAMRLAALSSATAVSGSVVIGLALAHNHITGAEAADAAHVDEMHQMERWGREQDAETHMLLRRAELLAVERFLALL